MRGKKKASQNDVDPGETKAVESVPVPPKQEPTIQNWHVLVGFMLEEKAHVHLVVQLLMLNTENGHAYLDYVTKYRHECIVHANPATDSTRIRPPIPRESGHRFHVNPATDST